MNAAGVACSRQARRFRYRRFRYIECRKQTLAADLSCDTHERAKCIVVGICDTAADTTIAVTEENTTFLIHRDFVEIEQVPVQDSAAAALPDATFALNGVVRRSVHHIPSVAGIIRGRHEQIPAAGEVLAFIITKDI